MMNASDVGMIEQAIRDILIALGEDIDREGLEDTPRRVARFYEEFFDYDPGFIDRTFEAVQADEMVVVSGIPAFSLCEHHLLPFKILASVGYIPKERGKIIGLSKIARIVQKHAHRLQLQERLVKDIADELVELVNPMGVAVIAKGEHTCMQMRGIQSQGQMITSVMLGVFRDKPEVRQEFLRLLNW